MEQEKEGKLSLPVLLFFHGGGWVTESVDTYNRVCATHGAVHRKNRRICRIPPGAGAPLSRRHLTTVMRRQRSFTLNHAILNADPKQITVIGDSAGGNLAAAVCLKARDTGDFQVERQILIYPALNNCYTEASAVSIGDGRTEPITC